MDGRDAESQSSIHRGVKPEVRLSLQPTNNSKNAKNMMNAFFGLFVFDFCFNYVYLYVAVML